MPRVLAVIIAAALLLAACSGGSSHDTATTSANTSGAGSSTANSADQIADAYSRAADDWVAAVDNAVDALNPYPAQLSVKQVTAAQLAAQQTYCGGAQRALTKVQTPPVLDPVADGRTTVTYRSATDRDRTLRAHAEAVQAQLSAFVRFCTWADAIEIGQPAAAKTNATLFAPPLRYTGTITVAGKQHTCPQGTSCYSPDQSLWPQMATLWQKQGAATAQGATSIKQNKIPCLVKGWEPMCDLVVQNQLDFQKWAGEYARAFADNKDTSLLVGNTEISTVAARFDTEVLLPLANLPGIYRQLAPGEKYDARVSTTGVNIWIDHVKTVLADLKAATKKL